MSEVLRSIGVVAIAFFAVILLLAAINGHITENQLDLLQRQAMARVYAQYCPDDARWAWKGECGG